jgi:hypothetical protein
MPTLFRDLSIFGSLFILLGAALGMIGVFMIWFIGDTSMLGVKYSGWDMYESSATAYYKWIPAVVLVLSMAAFASGMLSIFRKKAGGSAAIIIGIAVMVAYFAYGAYSSTVLVLPNMIITSKTAMVLLEFAGPGLLTVLPAGMISFIGGLALVLRERAAEQEAD